jgi:hypothetical protein
VTLLSVFALSVGEFDAIQISSGCCDIRSFGFIGDGGQGAADGDGYADDARRADAPMQLTRSSSRDHRLHGDPPKVRTAGPYERGLQHARIGSSAIKLNSKMISAYDERANAYEHTGVHDRAAADIAEAIKLDPNNPDLHKLR